ncbi:MAG: hypothetical protein MZW92_49895 [Comamonadaceae bacterium]|nr:hypothetical protein [Comamonadaceae bacterium]
MIKANAYGHGLLRAAGRCAMSPTAYAAARPGAARCGCATAGLRQPHPAAGRLLRARRSAASSPNTA